ncbi:unnamed protein product [Zymoseptoria tritici ST99CH_1E4]|uniref:Uncharacterized protein n=1 Tax=Zymoseptoria tritici ST99CH_1E4 TaxID=1276532 RepID=A0A2H1H974_ZYMTR|nr:unnamed protein product [Zymoseptoria tritici ST99CH_1E4]
MEEIFPTVTVTSAASQSLSTLHHPQPGTSAVITTATASHVQTITTPRAATIKNLLDGTEATMILSLSSMAPPTHAVIPATLAQGFDWANAKEDAVMLLYDDSQQYYTLAIVRPEQRAVELYATHKPESESEPEHSRTIERSLEELLCSLPECDSMAYTRTEMES